jgi:hypothetical protein
VESSLRDELDKTEDSLKALRSQMAVREKGIKGRVVKGSRAGYAGAREVRRSLSIDQALKVQRDRAEAEAEDQRKRAVAAEQERLLAAESSIKDASSIDDHMYGRLSLRNLLLACVYLLSLFVLLASSHMLTTLQVR